MFHHQQNVPWSQHVHDRESFQYADVHDWILILILKCKNTKEGAAWSHYKDFFKQTEDVLIPFKDADAGQ